MRFAKLLKMSLGLALLAALVLVPSCADAQDAKKPAAPAASDPHAAKRPVDQIIPEVNQALEQLGDATLRSVVLDESKRREMAPKAIPEFKKIQTLAAELKQTGDDRGTYDASILDSQILPLLVAYGDSDTVSQLQRTADTGKKDDAIEARAMLLAGRWMAASKDEAAQQKLLAQATELAKANPENEDLSRQLIMMMQFGPASDALRAQATELAAAMHTQAGTMIKQHNEMVAKMKQAEGKPLALEGPLADGHPFSTANWKGKVILIDFWATWCGPCKASLPRVKQTYAKYHDKGLELVGVSCDEELGDLTKFLAQNPDMPWPQLFDTKNPGWHALAKANGVESIPTMFLIDKKGNLRSVTAEEDFEEVIPKMLTE